LTVKSLDRNLTEADDILFSGSKVIYSTTPTTT